MLSRTTYESAQEAITEAHRVANLLREGVTNSSPVCIWRKNGVKLGKDQLYVYTLSLGWQPKPEGAGHLCMMVSASGIERTEGPWADQAAFNRALQS